MQHSAGVPATTGVGGGVGATGTTTTGTTGGGLASKSAFPSRGSLFLALRLGVGIHDSSRSTRWNLTVREQSQARKPTPRPVRSRPFPLSTFLSPAYAHTPADSHDATHAAALASSHPTTSSSHAPGTHTHTQGTHGHLRPGEPGTKTVTTSTTTVVPHPSVGDKVSGASVLRVRGEGRATLTARIVQARSTRWSERYALSCARNTELY